MRYIDKTNRCVDFDNFVAKYHGRLRNDWEYSEETSKK
jgi:hypothetical protein